MYDCVHPAKPFSSWEKPPYHSSVFYTLAVSLIRANLKKRNTDVIPGSGSSRTSLPGCLFSFSSVTKGFSCQANTNSSYPKYLHNMKGTQTHDLPLWRAMWPFRSRKQLWTTEGFDAGGDTSTCSMWGSQTKPTRSFIPSNFQISASLRSLSPPSTTYKAFKPTYIPRI